MSLNLYLLRHGQTELSRADVFCGSGLDPDLTSDGHEMAEAFAASYQTINWLGIFTSELRRTISTAQPLAEILKIAPEARAGLNEIGYGEWEGLSREVVDAKYHDAYANWLADPAWNAPTKGELAVEVSRRALQVVEEIERRCDGNVLIVSHKATIRILLCTLLGIDAGRFRYRFVCPVGSVSVVEFTAHGPSLTIFADRSHLSERLRTLPGT
jgi:probable phosphoglycerate mutase